MMVRESLRSRLEDILFKMESIWGISHGNYRKENSLRLAMERLGKYAEYN
jgi:hypothetical protein